MSNSFSDSIDEDSLDTVLASDVDFSGSMVFKDTIMIKGHVSGVIQAESDLHIDEKATVEANISAKNVSVRGVLKGNISALGFVELFASSKVDGDITAAQVTMEPGCKFNGICTMASVGGLQT